MVGNERPERWQADTCQGGAELTDRPSSSLHVRPRKVLRQLEEANTNKGDGTGAGVKVGALAKGCVHDPAFVGARYIQETQAKDAQEDDLLMAG